MVFDGRDGSKDRTDFYLAALNSHDGSSAFRFLVTPVRIVCANTQSAALGSAKASFAIRHTGGARASIAEARNALKLSWRYVEAFEAEAAQLYAAPMDTEEMRRFAHTLLEVDSAGTAATARHRRERANGIVKLWTSSPTIAPIAGTRWAAYNAVTEFLDHHRAHPRRTHRRRRQHRTRPAHHHRRRGQRIAQSPSVPPAADPVASPASHRGPASTCIRGVGRAPFSSREHPPWPVTRRVSPTLRHLPAYALAPPLGRAVARQTSLFGSAARAAATTPTCQLPATAAAQPRRRSAGRSAHPAQPIPAVRPRRAALQCRDSLRRDAYHSVGSVEPSSAASTASASHPWRTASRSATARARRALTP